MILQNKKVSQNVILYVVNGLSVNLFGFLYEGLIPKK